MPMSIPEAAQQKTKATVNYRELAMNSVDVVIPCYRYGRFLRESVESVLAQTATDVRVLIIDDASPDNTAEIATDLSRESSKVTFVRHATNRGHIATYNEGIDWVSAEYYMLLSADDYLLPGALNKSAKLMDTHPTVGFTFGQAIMLNDEDRLKPTGSNESELNWRILSGSDFINLSGARNIVPTPTAVVRTELQKRVGCYRPELPHSGDMEMWLRLAAHSDVASTASLLAVYRQHSGNMSLGYYEQSWLPDLRQRRAAIDCFLKDCWDVLPNAAEIHCNLSRLLAYDIVKFASSAFNCGEMDLSERLSNFAIEVYPGIKLSMPWTKLACKKWLGVTAWNAMHAYATKIRNIVE
jgi:Glycosyl transferase family 2